ncbi:unnamed protein product [Ilex paraguariensis]|uniref:Uncharacterized protein n=1 Tax=Ilex paraguariensis TaxID=185542 RepID=A0ABC8S9Z8_9AQUA
MKREQVHSQQLQCCGSMVFQELICGKGIRTQILLLWNDGWRRWSSCFALDCIDCSLQFYTDLEHGVAALLNDLKAGVSTLLQNQFEELANKEKFGDARNSGESKRRKLVVVGRDSVEPLQALRSAGRELIRA